MSSYVWWAAQQVARQGSTWVASHPAEASLVGVALGNPATRGFTIDVLKSVTWRSLQFQGRVAQDIARAAARRSAIARNIGSGLRWTGRVALRNPVTTIAAVYLALGATAIALSQDEDPRIQEAQTRSTSQGISGTGQPSLGGFDFGF